MILSRRRLGQPLDVQVPTTEMGDTVFPEGNSSRHESRVVELPYFGENDRSGVLDCPSVITVAWHEELAPEAVAPPLGVPLPTIVIPMLEGTVIPLFQVQEPDGI